MRTNNKWDRVCVCACTLSRTYTNPSFLQNYSYEAAKISIVTVRIHVVVWHIQKGFEIKSNKKDEEIAPEKSTHAIQSWIEGLTVIYHNFQRIKVNKNIRGLRSQRTHPYFHPLWTWNWPKTIIPICILNLAENSNWCNRLDLKINFRPIDNNTERQTFKSVLLSAKNIRKSLMTHIYSLYKS